MNHLPSKEKQDANIRAIIAGARKYLDESLVGASIEDSILATNRLEVTAAYLTKDCAPLPDDGPIRLGWTTDITV